MNGSPASPHPALATAGTRWLAVVVTGSLALAVLLLFIRRAMGALAAPLPVRFLAATLVVALAAGVLLRLGASSTSLAIRWGPTILLFLLAIALWLPGTSIGGALLIVGAIAGDVAVAILPGLINRPSTIRSSTTRFAANVTQQFTRSMAADGSESIEAHVRTPFAAGQRLEYCHVAFCPPLASAPHVSCKQMEGPPARVKVAQVFPHGVRIELRLDETAASESNVVLQLRVASGALTSRVPTHTPAMPAAETARTPPGR